MDYRLKEKIVMILGLLGNTEHVYSGNEECNVVGRRRCAPPVPSISPIYIDCATYSFLGIRE